MLAVHKALDPCGPGNLFEADGSLLRAPHRNVPMNEAKSGKTPGLSAHEEQEVSHNQPPRAAVLHEIIRAQGDKELQRSIAALWWSALAAGLTMGLSLMAMGLFYARLPEGGSSQVIASLGYSAGFLAVILARQQLFTENTLTAVLPVMTRPITLRASSQ